VHEIEIKLLVRPSDVARLKNHAFLWAGFEQAGAPTRQSSVYFDDRRRTLFKRHLALRVRHSGERRVQTLKAMNGFDAFGIARAEWEHDLPDGRPNLTFLSLTPVGPLLARRLRDPLEPVFESRVERTSFSLQFGQSEIVVSLDNGEIDTGKSTAPICELELELAHGSPNDLFRLAEQIDHSIPLELSYLSKSQRGYALMEGTGVDLTRSAPVRLTAGMSRADAFRAIAHECLRHALANRAGVARGDATALHQLRISTRRLRTAMALFRDVVHGPGADAVKAQLKWLRAETGPARDLDVFISEVMTPLRKQHPKERAVTSLYQHLRRRRLKAYRQARAAAASPQFRKAIFQIGGWIDDGDWRTNSDELTRARQDAPVDLYASERLALLHRKVRRKGRHLRELDETLRHRLRVQTKNLRYAAEFFASLAPTKKAAKRARELAGAAKDLQDALGALNDIAVRKSLSAEIAGKVAPGSAGKEPGRSRIFVAGLVAGHQEAHVGRLLDCAAKAYDDLRAVKPFWKSLLEPTAPAAASAASPPAAVTVPASPAPEPKAA
jgi:inorganic triphosphatase YgiF